MSRRIEIPMALETTGIRKGATDAEKALRDLEDATEDTGRSGAKDISQLEGELKDVQRQSEKTERAVDDIGGGGVKGFGKAGDAAGEFKSEALSNLSEVVSSFDGSMGSIGDLVQGTLGGLAGSLPGVLGAAGAAGAAAIGLTTAAFQKAEEAADDARESAYSYGITVAESGKYTDAASRIREYTDSIEGLKKVQDIATISGKSQQEVITALATGDGLPALTKAFNDGANSTTIATNRALELQGVLDGTAQGFSLSTDAAALNARALGDLARKAGTATGEVDDLGNEVRTMPDGKKIVIDAQTGEAYEDIDALEKKRLSTKQVKVTADTSSLDASLAKYRNKTIRVGAIQADKLRAPNGREIK